MEVDRHADRALYLQLADVLRDDITQGRVNPGERLPSEARLIEQHGVSRGTAREAIGTLRNEGLVVVEHGRGAFVRASELERLTRRVSEDQAFMSARRLFEQQTAAAGRAVSVREISGLPESSQLVGNDLELLPPEPVSDAWLGFADGQPMSLTRTWRAEGGEPKGDRVEERVTARMPTRNERRLLQLDQGAPVLEIVRRLMAGSTLAELSHCLLAAGRQSLFIEIST